MSQLGSLTFPLESAHDVVAAVREVVTAGPPDLFVGLGVGPADEGDGVEPGVPILWVVLTDSKGGADADRVAAGLRRIGPLGDNVARRTYLSIQTAADEDMAWGKRFYMKGGFLSDLSEPAMDTMLDAVATQPGGCSISLWAQGGAVARVPEDAMAFTGRQAAFWVGAEVYWTDPDQDEAHRHWGRSTMQALEPFTSAGHYVNDMVESGDDVVQGIYGPAKYERLVALKRAWDPDNAFRRNQNIRP